MTIQWKVQDGELITMKSQHPKPPMNAPPKNPNAVALGRLGGRAGRGPRKARPSWQAKHASLLGVKARIEANIRRKLEGEFRLVEKNNPLACHGIFDSLESAERFLRETVPVYCANGYYMDKTLTPESFKITSKLAEQKTQ